MGLFGRILVSFTIGVTLLTLLASRWLVGGKRWWATAAGIVVLNVVIGRYIMADDVWLHNEQSLMIPFLAGIIIFVAEVILVVMVLLAVLIRWLRRRWLAMLDRPVDTSRRRLLACGAAYPVAALGLAAYGGTIGRTDLVRRDFTIASPQYSGLDGYRIVQISDAHLGLFMSVDDLRILLEQAVATQADMLAVTGDIFDDVRQNDAAVELMAGYADRFPDGIWFCLGNHEYMRGVDHILQRLRATPVHVLVNEAAEVPGRGLYMMGVGYPFVKGPGFYERKRSYFAQALAAVPEGVPTVLLAHHPEFIDDAAAAGVPLTLTGHTHGSQFGLFGQPLLPVFKYTRGMVRIGGSYGYVHSGNGSWFPLRIGCPPELAVFTLRGC